MAIAAGTKLGRYEIRSMIGAGGMGEVYMAVDPKIGREVAIKVLPVAVADDKERLARFEQEAQAAGSLNHPNILAIYDVQADDGAPYVVSELLEGETLREIIGGTPLPIRKAVSLGLQVAHGLAAAHEKGIIHRDLKPENLFVTVDGRVKILDFGLAKLTETNGDITGTDLPTRRVNTDAGTIMGTVGYMSPEQLRGKPVDQRTDIFSFGTVLYEMLSGQKAFQKDSTADTISAILREDPPDLSETNKNVDAGLERIIHRCLEKNREERFHSASDLAFALEALSGISGSGVVSETSGMLQADTGDRRLWWLPWAIAGMLFVTAVSLGWLLLGRHQAPAQPIKFALTPPEKMSFGDSLALSPDGTKIAFIVLSETGEPSLWLRSLGSIDAQRMPGTEGASCPFWSPDSRSIGFFGAGKLRRLDIGGGPIQTIADAETDPRGASWGKDGIILFSPGVLTPIQKVPASGGSPVAVTEIDTQRGETSHRWPWFLPDGKHYLYFSRGVQKDSEGVFVGAIDSTEGKFLFPSKVAAMYAPPTDGSQIGRVLVVHDGMLISQPFDDRKLELTGDPVTIAQDVRSYPTEVGPTASMLVTVSNSGSLAYRTGGVSITQLQWADRNGKQSDPIVPPGEYREPMISPDGTRIAVSRRDGANQDVWMLDTGRNIMTRFTFDPMSDGDAVWDRTGANVIFSSFRGGSRGAIFRKPTSGLGSDELLFRCEGNAYPDGVSPDGKYLLVDIDNGAGTKYDVEILPLEGEDHTPIPFAKSQFTETHAQFSPDGRWVSYVSDESGRAEVYVRGFGSIGGQWQISTNGGDQPLWNPKTKELFYLGFDRTLYSVAYESGESFQPGKPQLLFQTRIPPSGIADERNNYLVTPDGQRFLLVNSVDESRNSPIVITLNWTSELK